jgi:hypothetical protein
MVTCREVREYMNQAGARLDSLGDLPAEISSHLTSCTSCLADRRVAWLKHRDTDVAVAEPPARTRTLLWTAAILIALAAAVWVFTHRA